MALFLPETSWTAPAPSQWPTWPKDGRVALDIETCDPQLKELGPGMYRDGYVIGIAVGIDNGPAVYLPIRHAGGGNLDEQQVWTYLQEQLNGFHGEIVGANLSYDLGYLWEHLDFPDTITYRDVLVAAPLLYELHMSYSLDNVAKRIGVNPKDESLLKEAAAQYGYNPKSEMWRMPAKYVGAYAEQDVISPLEVLKLQEVDIEEQGLKRVWDLESALLPVLVKMRKRGVRVDVDKLDAVDQKAYEQQTKAISEIKRITGRAVSPFNSASILKALEAGGVDLDTLPKTKTGKPSTAKDVLEGLEHPVAVNVLLARKAAKMRTAFVEGIRAAQIKGRIHCSFNQLRAQRDDGSLFGAAYGRMSSSNPNLQQVPKRGELGKLMRSVFIPEEGESWASIDYSAQEPRIVSHYAINLECPGSRELERAYKANPDLDLHQRTADQAGIERDTAKVVYLAKAYGAGGAKICMQLDLPTEMRSSPHFGEYLGAGPEGQDIIDRFESANPYLRVLAKKCQKFAERHGYVRTLLGRKCRFPLEPGGYGFTYKALNRVCQGSAADQMKQALVDADAAGHRLQLVIHDELCMSVKDESAANDVARIMTEAVTLRVPSIAEPQITESWGAK